MIGMLLGKFERFGDRSTEWTQAALFAESPLKRFD